MNSIQALLQEKKRLEDLGLSPDSSWIETAPVYGRKNWVQAYWRTNRPGVFNGKTRQYIGKVGSPKHQEALEKFHRRKQWESICKQLENHDHDQLPR